MNQLEKMVYISIRERKGITFESLKNQFSTVPYRQIKLIIEKLMKTKLVYRESKNKKVFYKTRNYLETYREVIR